MTIATMRLMVMLALAVVSTNAFAPIANIVSYSTSTTSLNAFDIGATANLIGAVDTFYHTQPYAAAFVTCSVKASAADLVVQSNTDDDASAATASSVEGANDFDISRTFAFWLYGGLYQGCMQEYLYNNVFPSVFGDSQSWITVLEQVALDMAVLTPFLCLPVAYLVKASVAQDENLLDGLSKYWNHVQNEKLLIRYWSLWAPVQVLTFGFIPHHLRIPFIAFVSFFWLMILSNISAQADSSSRDDSAVAAE